jgi:D-alanine-D-alanine ligase
MEAMITARIRVGVVFGGRSGEHEVSLLSAQSVIAALDPQRFEVVPLAITREGRWLLPWNAQVALRAGPATSGGAALAILPGDERSLAVAGGGQGPGRLDVVFPVLHGPNGEDGTIQGLLELAGIPYVGAGVLGSALGMDKAAQKDLFVRHGLPVVEYMLVRRRAFRADPGRIAAEVACRLGLPCFVKPANLGSSVGISRAGTESELVAALRVAAGYDARLLCERAVIQKRELECAILGNDAPEASVVGEVVPKHDFYDYEAKYTPGGAELIVPADLPPGVADEVRALALRAFEVLDCAGMARVDFFLDGATGRALINEVNTIPGFTATSMYPRLWEASGLPYRRLLTRLIELALERHADRGGAAPP